MKFSYKVLLIFLGCLITCYVTQAQDKAGTGTSDQSDTQKEEAKKGEEKEGEGKPEAAKPNTGYIKVIEIDPITELPKEPLPFDRSFVLLVHLSDEVLITETKVTYVRKRIKGNNEQRNLDEPVELKFKQNNNDLYIYVPPLRPNSFYDFYINTIPIAYLEKYFLLFSKLHAASVSDKDANLTQAKKIKDEINALKIRRGDPFLHIKTASIICTALKISEANTCSGCTDCNTLNNNPDQHIIEFQKFYEQHLKNEFTKISNQDELKKVVFEAIISVKKTTIDTKDYGINCCNITFETDYSADRKSISAQTHIFSFETRTSYSLNLDFGGIGYYGNEKFYGISPYLGIHVELRYFDKDVPFYLIPKTSPRFLHLSHWSIAAGITQASLAKEGYRSDFFKNTSFYTGIGYRLTNALRLTGGTLWYNKLDENPLIDNKRIAAVPYFGLSVDLQIRKFIQNLGFGPKLENLDFSNVIPSNRR